MNKLYKHYRDKLLSLIKNVLEKHDFEGALSLIDLCARMMYEWNQEYSCEELEMYLKEISEKVIEDRKLLFEEDIILVYDGFGLGNRGLMQIYLKALCGIKHVVYVTYFEYKDRISNLLDIVQAEDGEILFLEKKSNVLAIKNLYSKVIEYSPKYMFLYTTPWDVIGISVFNELKGTCKRYQVNLTDQAFWLGLNAFDTCIEFRNYGAYISNVYRKIPKRKLLKLPFYPQIDTKIEFQGFPFEQDLQNIKIMFSGGAIYKTLGDNGKFYKMVERILDENENVVFWYAGDSESRELIKLEKKYENRVFFTKERKDLYQIYKNCDLFLNTYPISGGLMLQYSVVAGVPPFTLKYDDESTGILLDDKEEKYIYNSEEELCLAVKKYLSDFTGKEKIKNEVRDAIISPEEFNEEMNSIIRENKTKYEIVYKVIEVEKFRKSYEERNNFMTCAYLISGKNNIKYFPQFPVEFFCGICGKVIKKIIGRFICR